MRLILAAIDGVNLLLKYVLALLLLMMTVGALGQVIVRFALPLIGFNASAAWTEEVARFSMIWTVFLGAAWALRHGELIALDVVTHAVPRAMGIAVKVLAYLACAAFCLLLVVIGLEFAEIGEIERSPVLGLSKWYVFMALPIGAGLMVMNILGFLLACIIEGSDPRGALDAVAD
ncbi:TRAP transporter small permease [Sediminicoccus sp. BL-A-41-H5]|uniref:TRAP transporter small permease n=1 Tax=Sediminicoccus sp. BL-A-41-H5 TaxID=3421106 RepID=UPI003D67A277